METVTEIRRQNLNFLIEQYKTIANLNLALGRPRHDSTLSQIRNQVKINKRQGLRSMGIAMARSIEEKLHLPVGWMDKIHDDKLPIPARQEEDTTDPIPLSEIQKITSIPVFIQPEKDLSGNCNPKLKGEIQLPNIMIDQFSEGGEHNLQGYIPTEAAMFKTLPLGSIVLVDTNVKKYIGDGLYFLRINGFYKFRKITQLINGNYEIESDVKKEIAEELNSINFIGKVTNIWLNVKV